MSDNPNIDGKGVSHDVHEAPSVLRASTFRAQPLFISQMFGLVYGLPTFLLGLAASVMTVVVAVQAQHRGTPSRRPDQYAKESR